MQGGKRRNAGLSLMEVLVVLVLVGLVSAMLLQGTTLLFGGYSQMKNRFDALEADKLPDRWFRNSVAKIVVSPDLDMQFRGNGEAFEATSLASVTYDDGLLTRVHWQLIENGSWIELLVRQNGGQPLLINRWRAHDARFIYYSDQQVSQNTWPVSEEEADRIPSAILLQLDLDRRQSFEILAATELKRIASADYRDTL